MGTRRLWQRKRGYGRAAATLLYYSTRLIVLEYCVLPKSTRLLLLCVAFSVSSVQEQLTPPPSHCGSINTPVRSSLRCRVSCPTRSATSCRSHTRTLLAPGGTFVPRSIAPSYLTLSFWTHTYLLKCSTRSCSTFACAAYKVFWSVQPHFSNPPLVPLMPNM